MLTYATSDGEYTIVENDKGQCSVLFYGAAKKVAKWFGNICSWTWYEVAGWLC